MRRRAAVLAVLAAVLLGSASWEGMPTVIRNEQRRFIAAVHDDGEIMLGRWVTCEDALRYSVGLQHDPMTGDLTWMRPKQ